VIAEDKPPEIIPLRNPGMGEMRPSWWLSCWMENVVVVEGTIEFTTTKADRITVDVSEEALQKHYDNQRDRDMQKSISTFYIGDLTVDKVLFSAPGIDLTDGTIAAMESGQLRKTKVLVPAMIFKDFDEPVFFNISAGKPNKGIFIFRYGSSVLRFPLVFDEPVPNDQLYNIDAVFTYRRQFDHIHQTGN
jgi:hypothetical protein